MNYRLLIFDKDPDRQHRYIETIQDLGVSIILIGSADVDVAIEKVYTAEPDLVLVDWQESEGVRFLLELQRLFRNTSVRHPRIVVVEDVQESAIQSMQILAKQHGADDFLPRDLANPSFRVFVAGHLALARRARAVTVEMDCTATFVTPEDVDAAARGSIYNDLAKDVGGPTRFATIISKHGVTSDGLVRLQQGLTPLARGPRAQRFFAAYEITGKYLEERPDDPVEAAVLEIAETMLLGNIEKDRPS